MLEWSSIVSMNKLTTQKRVQVLGALVEGNSIRSTVRMTGVSDYLWDLEYIVELLQKKEK